MDTGSRKWGRPYLNRTFFSLLSEAMADRILLMFAYDGDEPIAGTFSMIGYDRLYGRYWGAVEHVPCLHFEACYYQPLIWCIRHGYRRFEGGAQGEHKMARGLMPVETASAHWLAHPQFAEAVADFLSREGDGMAGYIDELNEHQPFKRTGPDGPRGAT